VASTHGAPVNPSFEGVPDFDGWMTIGNNVISTGFAGYVPTDGTKMANLSTGFPAVSDSNIETFLGLPAGTLDGLVGPPGTNATEGSAIKQAINGITLGFGVMDVTDTAVDSVLMVDNVRYDGTDLTFDYNFWSDETDQADVFNDFAFVSFIGPTVKLAEKLDLTQGPAAGSTGWRTYQSAAIPEPSSMAFCSLAVAGMALRVVRRRRRE
jgi:hypothetical protein